MVELHFLVDGRGREKGSKFARDHFIYNGSEADPGTHSLQSARPTEREIERERGEPFSRHLTSVFSSSPATYLIPGDRGPH